MKNYLAQYNRSTSHGLWIGSTVSLRREPYVNYHSGTIGSVISNIDGTFVIHNTQLINGNLTGRNQWSDGSLSFWISFNSLNFSSEQVFFQTTSILGSSRTIRTRLLKSSVTNELVLTTTFPSGVGTYSTGLTFSPNTLYHIVLNLSTTGITQNTGTNSQISTAQFAINGNPIQINRNSATDNTSQDFTNITLPGEPQFGSSNTNFNLFDIVYTPTRLNIDQVRALYNGGHGVELNEIKFRSPFSNGFVFDTLLFKRQLSVPQNFLSPYSSNNRGPQFGNLYIDYTNNGLSIPKQVYDNSESYQPYRNGINVSERSNIFPISSNISDYIYSGVNYVDISNLSGTFSGSGLDDVIPDSVDTIRLTNCTFLDTDTHIGASSSNYTALFLNGVTASNLFIWGSKKPFFLGITNCTINKLSIMRTPINSGECSTNIVRINSPIGFTNNRINEYFFGVTPSPVVFSNSLTLYSDSNEIMSEFLIGSTPTGQFYEITNSDQIGDSVRMFRSEHTSGNSPVTTLNQISGVSTGLQGLSSSITKPLSFSSSRFLYEIAIGSRNHRSMILPQESSLRTLLLSNVDLTTNEITNLNNHSTTLRKLELVNFDVSKPGAQNLDLSSFSAIQILGGYFSGSITFSSNDTLLDFRSYRNSNSARTSAGTAGPGLTTLNRIPLSTTTIFLSNNTTFTGITGTGGIDFGTGRTISISQFAAANCGFGFITVPTASSSFQFTTTFDISGTTQCVCPTFSGVTWTMFPAVNTNFNISNINHTSIPDIGLPLGTTIRSRSINIAQTFSSSLAMGLTALSNSIENIYNNWFNFNTVSTNNTLTWNHPGVSPSTGITPSGFTLGVSDGTFSSDLVTRIRELKYVLTTQTILGSTSSLKYRWTFTP